MSNSASLTNRSQELNRQSETLRIESDRLNDQSAA